MVRTAWWPLFVGCGGATGLPPVIECVGTGEVDAGDDGTIDSHASHVLGETWDELTTWPADGRDEVRVERNERDARGDLVTHLFEVRFDGEVFRSVTTWLRDPGVDGSLVLLETGVTSSTLPNVSPPPGVWWKEYTWQGDLLDQVLTFWEGDRVQETRHHYDADGRLVAQTLTPGLGGADTVETRTRTWFDPAPSFDYRTTQDTNSDGVPETEAELYHDAAGRLLRLDGVDHVSGTTWSRELTYDEAGREVSEVEVWTAAGMPPIVSETVTTRDADGRALEVLTRGTSGAVRARWSWDCP